MMIASSFSHHKRNFLWQPLLASTFVVMTLIALGGLSHINLLDVIGTGSLGSSAFLIFCMPNTLSAKIKNLFSGYTISAFLGILFYLWIHSSLTAGSATHHYWVDMAAVVTMTLSMLIMALFRLEHPPAVGFSLGLIVEPWTLHTLLFLFLGIILLAICKKLLHPWLIDLIA